MQADLGNLYRYSAYTILGLGSIGNFSLSLGSRKIQVDEVILCDQTYAVETMTGMMKKAGFNTVKVFLNWDNLPLYDAEEWVVYVAGKKL